MVEKRVGVIHSTDSEKKIVNLIGYGTYLGEYPLESNNDLGLMDIDSIHAPKIKLDNGKIVWGSDVSWWADESAIQESISTFKRQGYLIEDVNIDEIKKEI